ncbi:MAG: aminoacyl-tRNA hydrolase [Polyangiales bacterium]
MHLIAGLGNPGVKYAGNRHNVGFMVVERFAQAHGAPAFRSRFAGSMSKASIEGREAVVLEPATFMNLSGQSVQQALHFFKLGLDDLVVVHDELDLPFGAVRIKLGGGTAGHRGLRSIVECCGGTDFCRLRVGIGRPIGAGSTENYVLGDFGREESALLEDVLERASAALTDIVVRGAQAAMNAHNQRSRADS